MTVKPSRFGAGGAVVVSVAVGCLASCSSAPEPVPPLTAPPVDVAVSWFPGTPLSGPRIEGAEKTLQDILEKSSVDDAAGVRLHLFAVEKIPESLLEPLGSRTILIATTREGTPVQATTKLGIGARIGESTDLPALLKDLNSGHLARSAFICASSAALPRGATCGFRLEPRDGASDPNAGRAEIQVCRPPPAGSQAAGAPEGLQLALSLEGLAADEGTGTEGGRASAPGLAGGDTARGGAADSRQRAESRGPTRRREILLVDPELNPAVKPVAIFFPSPFKRWPSLAFAAIVEVSARPEVEAIDRIASRIEGNVEMPDAESLISAAVNPLEALAFPLRRRKALLFLATAGSARLTEGVALSGDDDVLARICARILERARKDGRKAEGKEEGETEGEADGKGTGKGASNGGGAPEGKGTKAEIAWLLESSTLEVLSALVADGQASPAVEGVLLNFAGQAGRQALSLEKALRASRGMEDLERLLAEENLLSLEDSSPAARARALRWLEARGMAPKGYDPLAPPRERRAALEKALAAEAKPQEGGKP